MSQLLTANTNEAIRHYVPLSDPKFDIDICIKTMQKERYANGHYEFCCYIITDHFFRHVHINLYMYYAYHSVERLLTYRDQFSNEDN